MALLSTYIDSPGYRAALQGTSRKNFNRSPSKQVKLTSDLFDVLAIPIVRETSRLALMELQNTSVAKHYVENGFWNVPVEQRPKNWKSWGIPEKTV